MRTRRLCDDLPCNGTSPLARHKPRRLDGFNAALRIAVLPDSSLVARKLCPVAPFIVASPAYLAEHGRPTYPRELDGHHCLGYA